MKPKDLRELSLDELKLKLKELEEMAFRYRFQTAMGKMSNAIKIRTNRRDVARIKTILHQKRIQTK